MTASHVPTRTCLGCRATAPAAALVRLAVADGRVVVDGRHDVPGRGAYLHPGPSCLQLALRRRAIPRGLRAVDVTGLADLPAHPLFA